MSLWLAFTFACKKDEDVSNCTRLEGTWQCESWVEDGEEFFGDTIFISSAEIIFKTLEGNQGDYDRNITYLIGGQESIIGAYTVNASCDEVTITPKGGSPTTYQFAISGDELTLGGNINNVQVELQFRKE